MASKPDMNIAKNLRLVDWLKNQILSSVSHLFTAVYKREKQAVINHIADTFIACYLLARRLGINFIQLETALLEKVQKSKEAGHEVEEWYGDLSNLQQYLETKRKR